MKPPLGERDPSPGGSDPPPGEPDPPQGGLGLLSGEEKKRDVVSCRLRELFTHFAAPNFYAAFQTPEEYRLMSGGKPLGTLPIDFPLFPGLFLIFGGRRWAVIEVDEEKKIVDLKPAMGGRLPDFPGGRGAPVHDRVRQEMLDVYRSTDVPPFLDARARDLLAEGRETFARFELGRAHLLPWSGGTLLFPWKGDCVLDTLVLWPSTLGHGVSQEGVALVFSDANPDRVREECARLAAEPPPDSVELAAAVINKKTEKFHLWLSDRLLTLDLASRGLDVAGAWGVMGGVGEI